MRRLVLSVCVGLWPFPVAAQDQEAKMTAVFPGPGVSEWYIVNDGVMGGLSTSRLEVRDDGTVVFTGFVSLKNNGGFASTRAPLSTTLASYDGVMLRVRGDGRRYEVNLRTHDGIDGVTYRAGFETRPGEWLEVRVPFGEFRASFRGYEPRGAGPLDPARVRQLGFLIGDSKEGPFQLEVAWLKAYRSSRNPEPRVREPVVP